MNNKLINIISEISGERKENIKKTDELINDIGFDSLMLIDLAHTIESEFELEENSIPYKEFSVHTTVSDIEKLINSESHESNNDYDEKVSIIEKFPEIEEFNELYRKENKNQPYFKLDEGIPTNSITIKGNKYINYSTYNYLGMNGDHRVSEAAKKAIDKFGTSVSGSRLLGGELEIHKQLEKEIANFLGTDDAIVEVGGHSTNVNTIGNIVNEKDLIIHDELAHNSIVQGAILSHAMRRSFKHNNMSSLEKILKRLRNNYRRTLIIVEGAYSMDGDICNLPELIRLKNLYGCILMIDEAHSFGTIGSRGAGVCDYFGIKAENIDILMGTLSKAAASCGGYIAGSQELINWLKFNSPGFVFSAGLTPPNTASALKAIEIFKNDQSMLKQLSRNAKILLEGIKKLGFDTGNSKDTPIIPLILGDSMKSAKLSNYLLQHKINALPIVYPAVKESEARIRFFVSSMHTKSDLDSTLTILEEAKKELGDL